MTCWQQNKHLFSSITISNRYALYNPDPVDLGFIAEAMLFYGAVRLIANAQFIESFVQKCGPEEAVELIQEGYLKITYTDRVPGVLTENTGTPFERYRPTILSAPTPNQVAPGTPVPRFDLQDVLPAAFINATGKSGRGRRLSSKIIDLIDVHQYGNDLTEQATADFQDSTYISHAITNLLPVIAPGYPTHNRIRFDIEQDGNMFRADTNIDFKELDRITNAVSGIGGSALSPAGLLIQIFDARVNLYFSSMYESEIATNPGYSAIIMTKYAEIMNKRDGSAKNIDEFETMLFARANAIREVINSGERTIKDLMPTLKEARKLHHWLADKAADASLVNEYYREVSKDSWVQKLPVKALRWAIPTAIGFGAGLISPEVGLLAGGGTALYGLADMFLIERLARGWNPIQFEGSLRQFLDEKK